MSVAAGIPYELRLETGPSSSREGGLVILKDVRRRFDERCQRLTKNKKGMKQKPADHRVVTVATLSPRGKPTAREVSGGEGVLEEHRNLMTRGELIFCLRDVHRYWSTPRISHSEIEELERQNLVERNSTAICAIRLTRDGARVKAAAQGVVKS